MRKILPLENKAKDPLFGKQKKRSSLWKAKQKILLLENKAKDPPFGKQSKRSSLWKAKQKILPLESKAKDPLFGKQSKRSSLWKTKQEGHRADYLAKKTWPARVMAPWPNLWHNMRPWTGHMDRPCMCAPMRSHACHVMDGAHLLGGGGVMGSVRKEEGMSASHSNRIT